MLTDCQHLEKAQYLFMNRCVENASIYFTTNFKAGNKEDVQYFLWVFHIMLFSAVMICQRNHIQHRNHLGKGMSKIHSCLRHSEQYTFFHWSKITTLKHKARHTQLFRCCRGRRSWQNVHD